MATTAILNGPKKLLREGRRFGRAILRSGVEKSARDLGTAAMQLGSGKINVPDDDGYLRFSAAGLIGGDAPFKELADLGRSWMKDPERVGSEKKDFLINLLRGQDLFAYPAILKLALHDEIVAGVARYFGQVPRMFNLNLWWSPPNESMKGSQFYHYDHRDTRQAKIFVNLNDVTDDSGPLHFVPAKECLKVDAKVGYTQERYTDDEVYSAVPQSVVVQATGPSGSAYIVDTARCLHYGSRGNRLDRLVLMISYARANAVEPGGGCKTLDPVRARLVKELYPNDPVRAFALTAPR